MKDDGGAAFPYGGTELDHVEVNPDGSPRPIFRAVSGMSLRDWFAGQALSGFANQLKLFEALSISLYEAGSSDNVNALECMASEAYRLADMMLSERNKGE